MAERLLSLNKNSTLIHTQTYSTKNLGKLLILTTMISCQAVCHVLSYRNTKRKRNLKIIEPELGFDYDLRGSRTQK